MVSAWRSVVLALVLILAGVPWHGAAEVVRAAEEPRQPETQDQSARPPGSEARAEQKPAAEEEQDEPGAEKAGSVERVYASARPALAVITFVARDGKSHRMGTGFVVSADGLIATNLHVIGEGRPISVQMANGKNYDVTAVHASDRTLDLAVLRVAAQGLEPLALGDSDNLRQGQSVVALGNPLGLKHSVVSGVVSGRRQFEDRSMIQLAIPLEPGNSGGPLVDMRGRVVGILTLKSTVTANLGFAVAANDLKPLLARPNPVPIERWVRQGTLDAHEWLPLLGANWRRRGGHIFVDGAGDGFGGRSLCLATAPPPDGPFELSVSVRLDDEKGAAGLAFAADGGDQHFGFYPSGGELRLTRFAGPDVLQWTILAQKATPYYRPEEWNQLRVRVEKQRLICSVNGHVVITADVADIPSGKVGLAKFRDTEAEFKNFHVSGELASDTGQELLTARIDKLVTELPEAGHVPLAVAEKLASDDSLSNAALALKADQLTRQAEQLRRLNEGVRLARVRAELVKALDRPEEEIDLIAAALWVARLDNDEVDVDSYRRQIDHLAADVAALVPAGADEAARLAALNKFFFEQSGFHGSRGEYSHRANSYLNEVLDDREGLPLTLSMIYIELARRQGLQVEGVGLPGHFVVRYRPTTGDSRLLDVFDGGAVVSQEEAERRVLASTRAPLTEEQQRAATKRSMILRMLQNLKGTAEGTEDWRAVLRYLDVLLALSPAAVQERGQRAMLRWQTGEREGAKEDVDWLLQNEPAGVDIDRLRDFRAMLERGAQ